MDPLPYQNPNTGNGASLRNGLFANDEALKTAVDAAEAAIGANAEAITGKANTSHTHAASDVSDFAEAVASSPEVAANTDKRSYPEVDQAKLAALPTREALTAEIAEAAGSGLTWNTATDIAATPSLAWGTGYIADLSANATIPEFTGTPINGSRIEWRGVVTGTRTISFPSSQRVGAEGSATSITLPPGNHRLVWQYAIVGETASIQLLDSGPESVAAEDVSMLDAGGYFASDNPEGALQEVGLKLLELGTGGLVEEVETFPAEPTLRQLYYDESDSKIKFRRADGVDTVSIDTTSTDLGAPALVSQSMGTTGQAVTLVFSRAVTAATPASAFGGFAISGTAIGAGNAATYVSGNGTTEVVVSIAVAANEEELLTLSYDPVEGHPINGSNSVALAAITDRSVSNGSEVPTPSGVVVQENFEGTGIPDGWRDNTGLNYDYEGARVISGAKSLAVENSFNFASKGFDVSGECFIFLRAYPWASSNDRIIQLFNGSSIIFELAFRADRVRLQPGGIDSLGAALTSPTTIKIRYRPASAPETPDGIVQIWLNKNSMSSDFSGSPSLSVTNFAEIVSIDAISLRAYGAENEPWIYDDVYISPTDFGSNPWGEE